MTNSVSIETLNDAHFLWENVLLNLSNKIRPHNFDMWLRPIVCRSLIEDELVLEAPNLYIKEWFEDNYLPIVLEELQQVTQKTFKISFEIDSQETSLPLSENATRETEPPSVGTNATSSSAASAPFHFEIHSRYLFDSFVVGPSNQLAHAAARAVADLPASKYNPLFIYGGVGLGKTHLLCAIGSAIKEKKANAKIAYISSEKFMNEYINHLRTNTIDEFRHRYRVECDILLMDDIQFIAGKDRTQDEFFHTFNALYDSSRQIVLTADKYPREIPDLEDRLRTRFQWGLIADIQQPDLETRVAILKKKSSMDHISIDDDVALLLATHIKSNIRELEGSLIRLAAIASLKNVPITLEFASSTLKDFFNQSASHINIDIIQKEVARFFNIKISDLKNARRHKLISYPRQIAMYLSRKMTSSSFPEIGQRFGGKDHTTVISACKKIEKLLNSDASLRSTLDTIEKQLSL